MEFTKEQYREGKDKMSRWFMARHWRDTESAKERIKQVLENADGLPFPPTQLTTGKDKYQAGGVAKAACLELIEEGILRQVEGPRKGFWVAAK